MMTNKITIKSMALGSQGLRYPPRPPNAMPFFIILLAFILVLILFIVFVLLIVDVATLQEFPTTWWDHVAFKLQGMGFDQNLIWSAMALCATIIGESPLLYIVGDDIGVCIALRFLCLCCLSSSKHKLFGMWATNLIVHCNPIWSMFKPPCMANPNWVNWMHRVVGMRLWKRVRGTKANTSRFLHFETSHLSYA